MFAGLSLILRKHFYKTFRIFLIIMNFLYIFNNFNTFYNTDFGKSTKHTPILIAERFQ